MSAATRARTPGKRARIAARIIRSGRRPGRSFADCFEMGDGDEVIAELRRMARRSPTLRANWTKYLSAPMEGVR